MNSLVTELQPAMLGLFLKGTIVLFLAAGATLLLRRGSASARYLIWSSALVILVALPVLPTVLPSWNLPVETYFLEFSLNAETQEEASRSASDGPQATLRGRVEGQGAGSIKTNATNATNETSKQHKQSKQNKRNEFRERELNVTNELPKFGETRFFFEDIASERNMCNLLSREARRDF